MGGPSPNRSCSCQRVTAAKRHIGPAKVQVSVLLFRSKPLSGWGWHHGASEALGAMNCGELCSPQAVTTRPFDTDRTAR